MNNSRTLLYIRIVFIILAVALAIAWGYNSRAYADGEGAPQLSIAGNGQVIVRDATVVSVTGNVVVVSTSWGEASFTWNVVTSGSTRFSPGGSSEALAAIKKGDAVSFSGRLANDAARPTVRAEYFKNASLMRESVTLRGVVESRDGGTSLLIDTDMGPVTVTVGTGTFVVRDGDAISLRSVREGDSIEVSGRLNMLTDTLAAGRINVERDSVPGIPNTGSESESDVYMELLRLLSSGSGGTAISMR